jgi:hypothetical protein
MAKMIIEGSPEKLATIKNRFRSLKGVRFSSYTEQSSRRNDVAVLSGISPSSDPSEGVKRRTRKPKTKE